jgi:hypothetical protein
MRAHKTATSPAASGAKYDERNTTGRNNPKSVNDTKISTNEATPILECPVLTSATRPVYLSIEDAERYSPKCLEGEFSEVCTHHRA